MSPHDNTNLADMHVLLQEWKDLHEMYEFDHSEGLLGFKTPKLIKKISKGLVKVSNQAQGELGKASNKWLDFKLVGDKGRLAIMKDFFIYIGGQMDNIDDDHITEMKEALSGITAVVNATQEPKITIKEYWLQVSEAKDDKQWKDAGDEKRLTYMKAFIEKMNECFNGKVDSNAVTKLKDALYKMEIFQQEWINLVIKYKA